MERLTYDFCINGMHCWQVKGADNLECGEVCESRNESGCIGCPIANAFDRLAAIEDILGDDYDLDRLRELVEADRDGRCVVQEYKPGDPVWVVERDEIEAPDCVSGYVFVAHANGAALVSTYLGDCGDVDAILADCIEETRETGECNIDVFPIEDCYHSIEDAESALKGGNHETDPV